MDRILPLKCIECGLEHGIKERDITCRRCGGLLEITYDYNVVLIDMEKSGWERRPLGVSGGMRSSYQS